ncbi:MAG: DUF1178 family protein [Burkholderiaceae bacterium]|nr:DUF1178 family protein [Burkholderiaceae bacterium]
MKVLDLACEHGHVFEGWFGSEDDYADQQARGLLQCPVCESTVVHKQLSAPRLNLASSREAVPVASGLSDDQQAVLLRAMRELVQSTEDVGERFAEEARRIHQGESTQRAIRGRASMAEAAELLEEGIGVLPLPNLPALKETLQ